MKEALDIYVKLLIAIISFIAPLLIHLLSVFSDGVAVKKRRWEEYSAQSNLLLRAAVQAATENIRILTTKSNSEFDKRKSDYEKDVRLLNPKTQIKYIFPLFFYSILCMIAHFLIFDIDKKDFCTNTVLLLNIICCCLIAISMIFAACGVLRLFRVAIAIIDVKQEIAAINEEEKQQFKGNKVTPS